MFLIFITSSPRPPLLGFKNFNPLICIAAVPDISRLPTSSTCVHLLKLPNYPTKEKLFSCLKESIYNCDGFNLS